ncbi:hypothetical protein [Succinimonas sp.]
MSKTALKLVFYGPKPLPAFMYWPVLSFDFHGSFAHLQSHIVKFLCQQR